MPSSIFDSRTPPKKHGIRFLVTQKETPDKNMEVVWVPCYSDGGVILFVSKSVGPELPDLQGPFLVTLLLVFVGLICWNPFAALRKHLSADEQRDSLQENQPDPQAHHPRSSQKTLADLETG